MTHAESQDLLLDLVYGELPPARAAELENHLAGCAECQREKAALDEARRLTAPVRELEEPRDGFDDRILAAARAQAQIEHGGNLGKVIEVQGSVRPLELSAAQIDAHRAVVRETRRQPRWAMRAVLGGSVAAAAALALVVTSSLQTRREAERAAHLAAAEKPYEIRVVAPAPSAVAEAAYDARKEDAAKVAREDAANVDREDAAKVARDDGASRQKGTTQLAHAAKKRAPPDAMIDLDDETGPAGANVVSGAARSGGSGGDALGGLASKDAQGASRSPPAAAPPASALPAAVPPAAAPPAAGPAAGPLAAPPPAAAPPAAAPPATAPPVAAPPSVPARVTAPARAVEPAAAKELAPPAPQKIAQGVSRTQPVATAAAQPKQSMPAAAEGEAVAERKVGVSNLPAAGVAELEKNAQDERHRGRYTLAASLYRRAAFVRGAGSAEGAWDLAHAIECLAAAGSFDEARQIRAELFRLHPNERTAYSAANRALREADAPGPPADQPALKAKAASEPDATLPVDH